MEALDLVAICRTGLLSRRFEERLLKLSMEGFLPPMLHPGAGHEIGQLATLQALRADDPVVYSHRGLAYMIGRGVPLAAMLSDIAGRVGGTNNGKGGIMHVVDTARGIYGESGTLGGGLVIATGMAMALKKKRAPQLVAHFFGDGGSNRGTFHESLNWSAVQKLPVLFICENNGWAVSVPTSRSTAVENIADRAAGYAIPGHVVDGRDAAAVHSVITEAADRARAGQGPSLIEIKMVRLLGHYATDPQAYRDGVDAGSLRDPLADLIDRLIASGQLSDAAIRTFEDEIAAEIDAAVAQAKAAPLLSAELAYTDLYA
ncbi:thiamine pyrophosphate-dependent dehydrogenase E1 component subunit alpha [Rhizorhabdus argentea]|uniref:thiamine pyrophosphate-dependent dehydrogenase E1 component subunit alpha n=1 Tax=Rhizorhabdus argentea TaxID=1387174 RepID=UPI0030EBAB94